MPHSEHEVQGSGANLFMQSIQITLAWVRTITGGELETKKSNLEQYLNSSQIYMYMKTEN